MNKSQLTEALAKAKNITLKKAEMVVNAVFANMADALVQTEHIEIRGFGSFKVIFYKGYTGRNPKTGDLIKVDSKQLPFFKVGKELRERVDRGAVCTFERLAMLAFSQDPTLEQKNEGQQVGVLQGHLGPGVDLPSAPRPR